MLKSKSTYKYLDFVKFSQLYNWSVQYLNDSKIQFTTKYPLVQIKEFLTRNKTAIEIQDDVYYGEFYQFNLSSCIRQQNSLTAQFVSFSLSNLANIFYPPPNFYNN